MHITNTVARKQNREAFTTGVSTAKTVCTEFERSLLRLKDQFIKFPKTRQELEELMDGFEEEHCDEMLLEVSGINYLTISKLRT